MKPFSVYRSLTGLLFLFISSGTMAQSLPAWYTQAIAHAEEKIAATANPLLVNLPYSGSGDIFIFPFETVDDGLGNHEWVLNNWTRWGAGFFPGQLWQLSFNDPTADWTNWAGLFSEPILRWKTRTDHDIGFNLLMSAGLGYDRTGDLTYLEVLQIGAEQFSNGHWMEPVGSLWSFNFNNSRTDYGRQVGGFKAFQNVIVDTSMNIELLFRASREGGDPLWWERGLSHMSNVYRDLVREDGSTIQIVDYHLQDTTDSVTNEINPAGSIRGTYGWQGYSNETTWSRGQAWAIYGFSVAYRETGDPTMLEAAKKTADYWIANVPANSIPYWDFDAMNPALTPNEFYTLLIADNKLPQDFNRDTDNKRDASAAAIAASGLIELATLTQNADDFSTYLSAAEAILETLSTPGEFLTVGMTYDSILAQGTYTFPGSDKGLSWGEYYFVEALGRYRQLLDLNIPFSGAIGFNQRTDFYESDATLWQTKWIQGKPRYVLNAAPLDSTSETPIASSLLTSPSFSNYLFEIDLAPLSNIETTNEAAIVIIFGYKDENNYSFLKLSSNFDEGGVFELKNGIISTIEIMPTPFLNSHSFKKLQIIAENDVLEVWNDSEPILMASIPESNSIGSIGFGSLSGGAAFSDIELLEITELRLTQSIINPMVETLEVQQALPTSTWLTNSGLPVDIEIMSGPATFNINGDLIATGLGNIHLRLTQVGNEFYSAAPPLHLNVSVFGGSLDYTAWASQNNIPNDPSIDSSGDGFPNMMAFALGFDPRSQINHRVLKPTVSNDGTKLYLEYTESTIANAVIRLQHSTNGQTWQDIYPGIDHSTIFEFNPTDLLNQTAVKTSLSINPSTSSLYRILVEAK